MDQTVRLWDVHYLTASLEDLARIACARFAHTEGRTFSELETIADPLIGEVWRDGKKDACDGVRGAGATPNRN